jgi:hypothetical protein
MYAARHARDSVKKLEVPVIVPGKLGYPVIFLDAQAFQCASKPANGGTSTTIQSGSL